jgi:hypothetical protein
MVLPPSELDSILKVITEIRHQGSMLDARCKSMDLLPFICSRLCQFLANARLGHFFGKTTSGTPGEEKLLRQDYAKTVDVWASPLS